MFRRIIRGEIDNTKKVLFDQFKNMQFPIDELATKMNVTPDEARRQYLEYISEISKTDKELAPETKIEASLPKIDKNAEYDSGVQKMLSFKGTIRPITLTLTNRGGKPYKMRVINLYVKPNKLVKYKDGTEKVRENTRLYEESVYSVNKGDILKGGEGYYPEKARWYEKSKKTEETPISGTSRKRRIVKATIKRKLALKHKNRCKCRTTKKR